MAASITPLRTRKDRERERGRDDLLHLLAEMHDLPVGPREELRAWLERKTQVDARWTFVMLSPAQNKAVVSWLRHNSSRPLVALTVWAECFDHLDPRTGQVMLSRQELARLAGATPMDITKVMGELAGVGAIIRHREPANGPVRYLMNPLIGTHLPKGPRELAQAEAPKLRLA